jgi:hypothetical protein
MRPDNDQDAGLFRARRIFAVMAASLHSLLPQLDIRDGPTPQAHTTLRSIAKAPGDARKLRKMPFSHRSKEGDLL